MKTQPLALALFCVVSLGSLTAAESATNTAPKGFAALFNGTDLSGWWGTDTENPSLYLALPPAGFKTKHDASLADIRKHWRVENGELVNDGKGLFLTSDNNYGDFELLVDFKTVPLTDSGIYLRGCPQVQIWDSTETAKFKLGADKGSGGLWNNSPGAPGKDPLVKADKPFGEWNHLRIVMAGPRVWVWLNGQATVAGAVMENYFNRKLPVPPRGPIQLQTHGGEIRWRNVFIREIGGDEANQLLRGTDSTGWIGPVDQYEVKDGAIVCYQEVTVRGSTLKVELNGSVILDADLNKVTGFAGHHDPVVLRNISIKPLN